MKSLKPWAIHTLVTLSGTLIACAPSAYVDDADNSHAAATASGATENAPNPNDDSLKAALIAALDPTNGAFSQIKPVSRCPTESPVAAPTGPFLTLAIGYAEGTVCSDGTPKLAYQHHSDSARDNVGVYSCTVCGYPDGGLMSPSDADTFYYETRIFAPIDKFLHAANGCWAKSAMMAATFFGLVVQSPARALESRPGRPNSFLDLMEDPKYRRCSPGDEPLDEDTLVAMLLEVWTENGRVVFRPPPSWNMTPEQAAKHDQRRRVRAYFDALKAQGFSDPYTNAIPTSG